MIACSAREIIMGRQSSLGPIDPQFMGIPAHNIKQEFEEAKADRNIKAKAEAKRIAEAEKAAREKKELDNIKSEIVEFFMANKSDISVIKPVLAICKEYGYSNPNEIDSIDVANKVWAACSK